VGVIEKLNALDEKAGVAGTASPKSWAQQVRLWWLGPVVVFATILVLSAVAYVSDLLTGVWMALPMFPIVFWSGFFYNERLRSTGRTPRYGRVPPGWPNETP
jgi:hypothetical protein